MTGCIGITLGDPTGIGPEVVLKALRKESLADETRYVLIGDPGWARRFNLELGIGLPLEDSGDNNARFRLLAPGAALPSNLGAGSPEAAESAFASLREGARRCLSRELDGLVTAPVNKESIVRAGHEDFIGQTELLSAIAGTDRTIMMLLGEDGTGHWLRVALATTHVPIRRLADALNQHSIELAIELAAKACSDLKLPRARVAVCGFNPHAGEGGKMGTEELTIVGPAVRASKAKGIDVTGPMSADALFHYAYRGDFEAVVAMYHDQGLAPLKMVCFEHGINWTLGLPFIRTSPDHGTAYDIAGKGIANESSMIAAIRLAKKLAGYPAPV